MEQNYLSLHSGQSLAWDHFRNVIVDPCGIVANPCGVIADPCGDWWSLMWRLEIDRRKREGKIVKSRVELEQPRPIKKHWPCS